MCYNACMCRFMKNCKQRHYFAIRHTVFSESHITKILFHIPVVTVFQKKKKKASVKYNCFSNATILLYQSKLSNHSSSFLRGKKITQVQKSVSMIYEPLCMLMIILYWKILLVNISLIIHPRIISVTSNSF